ncbi:ABC transporter permease [Sutcliffiella halmapala]|uniref:ABC transporter permease n=1 Tax=Sutcliffiella halmapala TaxID=79882 RepID=UPI000995DC0C|nr:ABC transporter permease [Sutcliffiella halmapala]
MGSFFRKDLLVFWRDRKEILISLLVPIVIIIVLTFAFSGLMGEDAETMDINVGIVLQDDESLGLQQFEEVILAMDLPEQEKEAMTEQAAMFSPVGLLNAFLNDPELSEWLNTKQLSAEEAKQLVKSGELDAVIKIPEGYTYDVLGQIILGESANTSLAIQMEEQSLESDVLYNIMERYLDTLNFQLALSSVTDGEAIAPILPLGGREVIEGIETLTISQYFTHAMTTLFTLFIAATVAMKTVTEKRERVFNRILLTNSNPISYLMGKVLSTFCFAWLQLMIIFSVSQLLLNVFPSKSMEFWFGIILIITFFSMAVAGMSAVFTLLTLKLQNSDAANGLFTMIIMMMAVVGGNFFPIYGLPEWIQRIGEWTPNGLSLSVYIQWVQSGDLSSLVIPMIKLFLFSVGCIIIASLMFPKRGRI